MKICVLKETFPYETRVAATPDTVKEYIKAGFQVVIEKGAGVGSLISDHAFAEAGAYLSSIPLEIVSDADIILKVQPSAPGSGVTELNAAKKGAYIIGLFANNEHSKAVEAYRAQGLNILQLEAVPRTSFAQAMDVLSSQSNLAGYRAVIEALSVYSSAFPMMMTAAGTVHPAKVLVMGVGVAGLQAIATAKRMGAVVSAYDVRSATKEQVESLGAKFLQLPITNNYEAKSGYATELSAADKKLQEDALSAAVAKSDIVITTAQIPGKKAPILVSKEMVNAMKPGSVIVDMAALSGGNVELSAKDDIVTAKNGVTIIGYSNLAARIPAASSKLYAKNISNLVGHLFKDKKFAEHDEIAKAILLR